MAKIKVSVNFSPKGKKGAASFFSANQKSNSSGVPVEVSEKKYPVVAFRIHDRWFALKQHLIHQVASFAVPRILPGKTNEVLLGLVYAAGTNYLCFSFHGLLQVMMPDESFLRKNGRPRLIVIGAREDRWAFIVEDMVVTTTSMSQDQKKKMGTTTAWGDITVLWSFDLQGKNVALLDEETLFAVLNRSLVV